MTVGLAPILFVLMVSMTAVQSQIQRRPANALKRAGDSVTLECVTSSNNCDKVDWHKVEGRKSMKQVYRNGIGMVNNDVYPPHRYRVNSTGGCSLTITQLEIYDSGRFICMQAVEAKDTLRSSILVVIGVKASCLSNVTSNALDKDDGYRFWCAINIPAKSVEPSSVTLSFHNKAVGETETTDENQPLTVRTMLTGTAKMVNSMPRVCRASFLPNTEANDDNTVAFLDVCTTEQWIVSFPVENVFFSVSPPGPDKSVTVRCTAGGHPPPTFKWTIGKSGAVVDGDTLVIKADAGAKYTCTATNTVNGKEISQNITIEFTPPPPPPSCGPGCIAGIVTGTIIGSGVIGGVTYVGWKYVWSPLFVSLYSRKEKNSD